LGVGHNFKQAIIWFTKAAQQGNANAQSQLGICYYLGFGVEKDFKQAIPWLTKAAQQGDDYAQHALSVCYYHGEGVEIDYWQAYFWLNKAAEKGNIHSKKDIAELKELSKLNVANLGSYNVLK